MSMPLRGQSCLSADRGRLPKSVWPIAYRLFVVVVCSLAWMSPSVGGHHVHVMWRVWIPSTSMRVCRIASNNRHETTTHRRRRYSGSRPFYTGGDEFYWHLFWQDVLESGARARYGYPCLDAGSALHWLGQEVMGAQKGERTGIMANSANA